MAQIVTEAAIPQAGQLSQYAYCGIDCAVTRKVADVLRLRLTPGQELTYRFELASQGPAMSMMARGFGIDEDARAKLQGELKEEYESTVDALVYLIGARWDKLEKETGTCPKSKRKDGKHSWPRCGTKPSDPTASRDTGPCEACTAPRWKPRRFNPKSDDDTQHLLYEILGVPVQRNKLGKVSTDKEILDRLERSSATGRPFVGRIKNARHLWKLVGVLEKAKGGRYWYSMNVGAPETGRWSSSANPFDEGDNAQNVTEPLRRVFIADPGRWVFVADLSQAESFVLANMAGDEKYIAAHKTGDVHTYVSRLVWPELPWTGDLAKDKRLAEDTYPPWDTANSYRTNCKRVQHGSNYVLTPLGVARHAHIPVVAAREFQDHYFHQFAGIRRYHHWCARQVIDYGEVTTPLGRRRQFFGKRWLGGGALDGHTHRQAVAYGPQSTVAEVLNIALWGVWSEMDPDQLEVLVNGHDAIIGQSRCASKSEGAIRRLVELMQIPIRVKGIDNVERIMVIPVDVKVGENWGKWHKDKNPGGVR